MIKVHLITFLLATFFILNSCSKTNEPSDNLPDISGYPLIGTNQVKYFDNHHEISEPLAGDDFYGQDACFAYHEVDYTDNGDGTITDNITGLMWQQSPDNNGDGKINAEDKLTYEEAVAGAGNCNLGGYSDWRLPGIKELYSLIQFSGVDPSGYEGTSTDGLIPFIDQSYFNFAYGDLDAGERIIDAQYASSTKYVATTMNGDETLFGVNFADGRIKGYGLEIQQQDKTFYVIYVRGNKEYGVNDFQDNGDGTISDHATSLMWAQNDNGEGILWKDALHYADTANIAGYSDWRLPNIKELQSIVNYDRSTETTASPSIDPLFICTEILNENNETDYPYYWSSTTHESWLIGMEGSNAAYISFGRAMGFMEQWTDVHGAGAQRSDPKTGDPGDYPNGHGPQGDAIRIFNFVRLVRSI